VGRMKVRFIIVLCNIIFCIGVFSFFDDLISRRVKEYNETPLVKAYSEAESAFYAYSKYFIRDASHFIESWRNKGFPADKDLPWLKGIAKVLGIKDIEVIEGLKDEEKFKGLVDKLCVGLLELLIQEIKDGKGYLLKDVNLIAFPIVGYLRSIYENALKEGNQSKRLLIMDILNTRTEEPEEVVKFLKEILTSKDQRISSDEKRYAFKKLSTYRHKLALKELLSLEGHVLGLGIREKVFDQAVNNLAGNVLPRFNNFWDLQKLWEDYGKVWIRLDKGNFVEIQMLYPIPFLGGACVNFGRAFPYEDEEFREVKFIRWRYFRKRLAVPVVWNEILPEIGN
jgi:hypothetical protein